MSREFLFVDGAFVRAEQRRADLRCPCARKSRRADLHGPHLSKEISVGPSLIFAERIPFF